MVFFYLASVQDKDLTHLLCLLDFFVFLCIL